MAEKKMTQREFFTAVANEDITEEIVTYAENAITKLDAKNAARAARPSKKAVENEPIKAAIVEFLNGADAPVTAKAVTDALNVERAEDEKFATQKISALLVQLTKAGEVTQGEEKKTKIYSV